MTSGWDETANFTGMDEYWAGMRRFDEGCARRGRAPAAPPPPAASAQPRLAPCGREEEAWWNDWSEEGDVYDWEDEGNYTGCNCPAYCVSHGWMYQVRTAPDRS